MNGIPDKEKHNRERELTVCLMVDSVLAEEGTSHPKSLVDGFLYLLHKNEMIIIYIYIYIIYIII